MEPLVCIDVAQCTLISELTLAVNTNYQALVLELQTENEALQTSLTTLYVVNYALLITLALLTLNSIFHHFFEKRY